MYANLPFKNDTHIRKGLLCERVEPRCIVVTAHTRPNFSLISFGHVCFPMNNACTKMLLPLSVVCVVHVERTTIRTSAITLTRAHCVGRAARSARLGNIILQALSSSTPIFFFPPRCHFTPRGGD